MAAAIATRRLAAILAADAAGYSRLGRCRTLFRKSRRVDLILSSVELILYSAELFPCSLA